VYHVIFKEILKMLNISFLKGNGVESFLKEKGENKQQQRLRH